MARKYDIHVVVAHSLYIVFYRQRVLNLSNKALFAAAGNHPTHDVTRR